MIKDTFLSLPRFANLCRKEMVENWKQNALRVVLMYGVMAIVFLWIGYFDYRHSDSEHYLTNYMNYDPGWDTVLVSFCIFLFGFGCLSASFTLEKMKNKTGKLSTLMTPVTPFENYFLRWLVSTVIFLIIFLIAFKLADYTRVLVYSLIHPYASKTILAVNLGDIVENNSGNGRYHIFREMYQLKLAFSVYLFAQSLFVLGSSVWPKNSFLKTFAAVAMMVLIYITVAVSLGNVLYNKFGHSYSLLTPYTDEQIITVITAILFFFSLFNWILAYFRFKESEIIQRM